MKTFIKACEIEREKSEWKSRRVSVVSDFCARAYKFDGVSTERAFVIQTILCFKTAREHEREREKKRAQKTEIACAINIGENPTTKSIFALVSVCVTY